MARGNQSELNREFAVYRRMTYRRLALVTVFAPFLLGADRSSTQPSINELTGRLLAEWQPRLQHEHLESLAAPPFILAGDGGAARLASYRDDTILASARALHAMYFEREPRQPILILLFEREGAYKRLANEWFGDADVPHFGFYRPGDRVMLMNVGTGTGTLVHELTHALIAPDFPQVPSWFNEGLASLYEQSSIGPDSIQGRVNWRLPALQKAIRAGTLRSLPEMIENPDFYDAGHVGLNYAQARYLMFYLQETQRLRTFYRQFRDHVKEDPTGRQTLERLIAPQSVEAFEKEWRAWVLGLKFEN